MTSVSISWEEHRARIENASTLDEVDALEQMLFGRKNGIVTLAFKDLHTLPPEQKKDHAHILNQQKKLLEETIATKRASLNTSHFDRLAQEEGIDVTLTLPPKERGHLHPIPEFIRQVEDIFGRMGFDVWDGPEVETEENNFDLLNFPKDHAARDTQDIFYLANPSLKKQPSRPLLRAHTSTVQVHYMRSHKPPFRAIFPGKCYRRDADATHSPMFHQFEGLMLGKDVSLANLKAVLIAVVHELIDPSVTFRFRTGYFPFVEPGLEMDIRWAGDLEKSREGTWLEMGGLGMVHPNVLKNVGIDPKEWQGFAFGFGIERMLMIKHQIPDLRSFYAGDLRFLRQF